MGRLGKARCKEVDNVGTFLVILIAHAEDTITDHLVWHQSSNSTDSETRRWELVCEQAQNRQVMAHRVLCQYTVQDILQHWHGPSFCL